MKIISVIIIIVLSSITLYANDQVESSFKAKCIEVLKNEFETYIAKYESDDYKGLKKVYVLTISDFSVKKEIFNFSISFICSDFEVDKVNAKGIVEIEDYIILVRTNDVNFDKELLNEILFIPWDDELKIQISAKLNHPPKTPFYNSMYMIVNVKNEIVENSGFLEDPWSIDSKYIKQDYDPSLINKYRIEEVSDQEIDSLLNPR